MWLILIAMPKTRIEEIVTIMQNTAVAKQQAYEATWAVLKEFKQVLKGYEHNLSEQVAGAHKNLEIKFTDIGDFEAHFKFGGETLVFMMHTNIFDFEKTHAITKSEYVKEDPMREYCGLIQVYNFLSDSLKYNRGGDMGALVTRIFVNREKHFFMDGHRPFSFLYNDFTNMVMNEMYINNILEECMLYCLNIDLMAPPFDMITSISVEQKNYNSYNSGFNTSKVGFRAQLENEL